MNDDYESMINVHCVAPCKPVKHFNNTYIIAKFESIYFPSFFYILDIMHMHYRKNREAYTGFHFFEFRGGDMTILQLKMRTILLLKKSAYSGDCATKKNDDQKFRKMIPKLGTIVFFSVLKYKRDPKFLGENTQNYPLYVR